MSDKQYEQANFDKKVMPKLKGLREQQRKNLSMTFLSWSNWAGMLWDELVRLKSPMVPPVRKGSVKRG